MLAKRLFRLSTSLRRSSILTQQVLAYHVTPIEKIKDNRSSLPFENANVDELMSELKSRFPSKVLVTLEANKNIIKGPHIIVALQSLVKSYKREISNKSIKTTDPSNHHAFLKPIYAIIDSRIDQLTNSEAIEILSLFAKIKIPISVDTVQLILKHICNNLNDMSLIDFGTLSLIIRRMPQSPLIKGVQKALEKKFVVKLSIDFDENNITFLESALSFISYHVNGKNYELLEHVIQSLENYKDDISLKSSILILESLCNMRYHPKGWLDILHRVEDVILNNIKELNVNQVNFIIYILSERLKSADILLAKEFYNPDFIDTLIQKLISDDVGLNSALSAIKCLCFIRHESKELLNYTFATYFEKTILSGETFDDHINKLLVLISGASAMMHKNIFWKEIEDFIMKSDSILKYSHETLTICALNLLCLESYHHSMLRTIFDCNYDYSKEQFLHWTFCKIYQKLKVEQNYDGPVASESQINALKRLSFETYKKKGKKREDLVDYLRDGLGGSDYVKSDFTTKLFHLIDHVVILDKNGNPVPISTETNKSETDTLNYLENLKVPPASKVIVIILMPHYWFFRNSGNLMGNFKIVVNTLEAMSYKVVAIDESMWYTIPKEQKTSFLMKEIRS
ncbi:hypothetical protein TSAR_009290 [Trichomalopsis sarcophagae]|uniref:FAST kinase-like protein subdomain 2 domain-containing protein n=1 Tax=Trichomalopsis sarcophagae TaxID=543379 RepID=A0A232F599_9HYME|nr:hypothetical protein TSAR_009290 [Trichomalopsis sarcophagae]